MAKYLVLAKIKGLDEPAELVAGPFTSRAQATTFAKAQQEQVPDPEDGDVVFYTQKVESQP